MITVTERAAVHLQEVLAARDVPPGHRVKLVPQGPGSVGLTIAAPEAGDAVIQYEDAPVLIVDGQLTAALAGTEIDCEESVVAGQARTEYTIRRPAPEGRGGEGGGTRGTSSGSSTRNPCWARSTSSSPSSRPTPSRRGSAAATQSPFSRATALTPPKNPLIP